MTLENKQKLNLIKNINPEGIKTVVKTIISLIIPILIYASILAIDLPEELGSAARYGVSWLLAGLALLLYVSYGLPGWLGRVSSLSSTLVLFALPLARLWSTGASEAMVLGGLLPWSDANAYYRHASNLLQGLSMEATYHAQRPVFVGILAVVLRLTQQNLQITIAILTALIAISCFFVAREIQQTYGTAAGILVILCLFIFIRPLIGTTMTENSGLCLGLLSFTMLLRGARQMRMGIILLGIFVLTIALNARTGAFFVLPALVVWGGSVFRDSKWFSRQFLLGGAIVILLGFMGNSLLLKVIGHPEGSSSYGNFAVMFYGVITQSNWMQIYQDYPEINQLGKAQFSERTYAIVWETIRENPLISIRGIIQQWREFFFNSYFSIFFIERNELEASLRVLGSIGLVACLFKLRKPSASLTIMYALGVIASVPFLAGSFRTYAATVIIFSLLSALGLALILQKLIQPILRFCLNLLERRVLIPHLNLTHFLSTNAQQDSSILPSWQEQALPIFSLALVIVSFIGPITIKQVSHAPQTSHLSCPSGLEARYFRNNLGSSINLVSDETVIDSHLPNIRISDFRRGLKTFAPWLKEEPEAFAKLRAGLTILDTYSRQWLVVKSNIIPQERGWILACGTRETIGELNLFRADYLEPVSSQAKGK